MSANPERGEHELELGHKVYRLRPSYEAIEAIERKSDKALIDIVRVGNSGAMPFKLLGVVAAELIRAGADEDDKLTRNVSPEKIAPLIFEAGVAPAIARITLCLLDAATGGRKASGEAQAVAQDLETEDPATAN
jgi:hypothetical protein